MGFLSYQANWAKRKKIGRLKAGKTITCTSNFDTKDCAELLRTSLTGTTELVEIVIDLNSLAIINLTSTSVND